MLCSPLRGMAFPLLISPTSLSEGQSALTFAWVQLGSFSSPGVYAVLPTQLMLSIKGCGKLPASIAFGWPTQYAPLVLPQGIHGGYRKRDKPSFLVPNSSPNLPYLQEIQTKFYSLLIIVCLCREKASLSTTIPVISAANPCMFPGMLTSL